MRRVLGGKARFTPIAPRTKSSSEWRVHACNDYSHRRRDSRLWPTTLARRGTRAKSESLGEEIASRYIFGLQQFPSLWPATATQVIPAIPRDNGDDVEPRTRLQPQPSDPGPTAARPPDADAVLVCALWSDFSWTNCFSRRCCTCTGLPYYFAIDEPLRTPRSTTQDNNKCSTSRFVHVTSRLLEHVHPFFVTMSANEIRDFLTHIREVEHAQLVYH